VQNLTRLLKNFWIKSQFPDRNPAKFSRIDNLIIFLICIVIAVISSYKILINYPNNIGTIFEWLITFCEVLIFCYLLIFISKKENPMINSRQMVLIIGLLLLAQWTKTNFQNISPLAIVIPPSLIISQGMGTLTALSWVSIACINWPESITGINNSLLFITFICACIVSFFGGRIRNRAQSLQIAFLVPFGALLSQLIFIAKDNSNTNILNSSILINPQGDFFSDSILLAILLLGIILLMPIFESIFGLLTKSRLLELADNEKPLLRRLSIEAPGTFEHTLLICGLAEEATRTIGGDVDLIKTGALYHDIGKLHAPTWFIENQNGKYNPHEELNDPFKSADILQEHVDQGLRFAKKNRLPQSIANFIPEHQGTLKMGYFLHQAREKNINVSENDFRYKGPIPQSKETAILMLADGCEAALRAMNIEASDEEAIKLISTIVSARENDGQLVDSQLSKSEIFLIKRSFLNVWKRIKHRRIQYPTSKNNTFS
tara:strand:+ start:8812 stop:10278 length:1467 start_codon:yes stop_codon:yes gene_type:complete